MLDRASLAGETTALNGCDDVILARALGYTERLVDDEAQLRTCKIHFLVAAIDDDFTCARL